MTEHAHKETTHEKSHKKSESSCATACSCTIHHSKHAPGKLNETCDLPVTFNTQHILYVFDWQGIQDCPNGRYEIVMSNGKSFHSDDNPLG